MLLRNLLPPLCCLLIGEDLNQSLKDQVSAPFHSLTHSLELKITELSVEIGKEWKQMSEDQQSVSVFN